MEGEEKKVVNKEVENSKSKDGFVSYLQSQGTYLIEFPEKLIGELSYKELTLNDAVTKEEFKRNTGYKSEKIKLEVTAKSTFATDLLLDFLKLCKKVDAEKVKLEIGSDSPIKITAYNKNDEEVLRYWLAPVVEY